MTDKVAILIVSGGSEPVSGKWLDLCIRKVREYTTHSDYHLYVWNHNWEDPWVENLLGAIPNATLVQSRPGERMAHPHADPLQRLYERARADRARYILTLDSDAHPIRRGWLARLVGAIDGDTVLAGVWRDELRFGIAPYVHASCLCTTVDFIERNGLRLDYIATDIGKRHDTLSCFTDKALALNRGIHKLCRSNRNNLHRLIGGIYGDLVYHHGAGSRSSVSFWDEKADQARTQFNMAVRDQAEKLLFEHYAEYIGWLRGCAAQATDGQSADVFFILGMHRSGTSCLAGCLERCGLHLGDVSRTNRYNPKGNLELAEVIAFHDAVLAVNGGAWDAPPEKVALDHAQREALAGIVARLTKFKPCGLKDPRMLLLAPAWLETAPSFALVGSFRHPAAVARSLAIRDRMPQEQADALWMRYNRELIALHREYHFPLVEFDLSDPDEYCESVATMAVRLGLNPDLRELKSFVSAELDRGSSLEAEVPSACQEVYAYLRQNRLTPTPSGDAFAQAVIRYNERYGPSDSLTEPQPRPSVLRRGVSALTFPFRRLLRRLLGGLNR